jgi:hypothetical protein
MSSFASSIWTVRPDQTGPTGFTFTQLDSGAYSLEAVRFDAVQKPAQPKKITYHGGVERVDIKAGQAGKVNLKPQTYQTRMRIQVGENPYAVAGPMTGTLLMISRNPGLLLWADGKFHHLEDPRLGRMQRQSYIMIPLTDTAPLQMDNFPPGTYVVLAGQLGQYPFQDSTFRALYLRGVQVELHTGRDKVVEFPRREPDGPSLVNTYRLSRPIALEAKDYTVSDLCERINEVTENGPALQMEPPVENMTVLIEDREMVIWELLEKLYLEKGLKLKEKDNKTFLLSSE